MSHQSVRAGVTCGVAGGLLTAKPESGVAFWPCTRGPRYVLVGMEAGHTRLQGAPAYQRTPRLFHWHRPQPRLPRCKPTGTSQCCGSLGKSNGECTLALPARI